MDEGDLRELMGIGAAPEVSFAGQRWKLRADGFVSLLSYAQAGINAPPEGGEEQSLAALHKLLEGTLADFEGFSDAALESKADLEEVQEAGRRIVAVYCARNFWPAMRLLGYVAANLEELDGQLILRGGQGIAHLTPREACNLALAMSLEGREEEDRQIFLEDLNFQGSPEAEALEQLRAYQAAQREAADGGD